MIPLNLCRSCLKLAEKSVPTNINFEGTCGLCLNLLTQSENIIFELKEQAKEYEFHTYRFDVQEIPIISTSHFFWCQKVHGLNLNELETPRDVLREEIRMKLQEAFPNKEQVINSTADLIVTVEFDCEHNVIKEYGKFLKFNMAKRKRNKVSRENLEKACRKKNDEQWKNFKPTCPGLSYHFKFWKPSVLLGFRYNKFSRKVSHSDSFGRLGEETSIEQMVQIKIKEFIRHDGHVFVSCGREDMDVLMLGRGRPAVFELKSPLLTTIKPELLEEVQKNINETFKNMMKITNLRVVDTQYYKWIKNETEMKDKSYRCVVWCEKDFSQKELDEKIPKGQLNIKQWTPSRVLHRRPNLERDRYIKNMRAQIIKPNWLVFYLTTQAGTYVKEFIHSDRGRTAPHLGSFLNANAIITQLDVMNVHTGRD